MGYGAFLRVQNNRKDHLQLFVTDVTCMYDKGEAGSNLSLFNDVQVAAGAAIPAASTQYLEVKASGTCFFETSTFTIKIEGASGAVIGTATFEESDNTYFYSTTNKDLINIYLNDSGNQADIVITVT